VTDRAPSEARSVLAARLAATAGGDAGLVSAMTAAWSDLDALAPDAREDALAVAARISRLVAAAVMLRNSATLSTTVRSSKFIFKNYLIMFMGFSCFS